MSVSSDSLSEHSMNLPQAQCFDPTLSDGFSVVYDRQLNLEFRNLQNEESENKVVRVRVLVEKENKILKEVRLEVMDDGDLFFLVEASFTEETFATMSKEHELLISFDAFPSEISQMLDLSTSSSEERYTITFEEEESGAGTMNFLQMTEFKAVEIFRIKFDLSNEQRIQEYAQFRYTQLFNQLQLQKKMLAEFNSQMKSKNPTLLKKINESPKKVTKLHE